MNRTEFEESYIEELTNDEAIEIDGFEVYPILVKDYYKFVAASFVLTINKDSTPDARIISMSNLQYLFTLIDQEDLSDAPKVLSSAFYLIMSLCLRKDAVNIKYGSTNGKYRVFVNDLELTPKIFDKFRKIVMYQNLPTYDDSPINPQLAADLAEAERLRNSGSKPCSFEKQQVSLAIGTSMRLEDIRSLTIRKFQFFLQMIDRKISYQLCMTAALTTPTPNGTKDILHYLSEKSTDDFEDKVIDYNGFQKKLGSAVKTF